MIEAKAEAADLLCLYTVGFADLLYLRALSSSAFTLSATWHSKETTSLL